MDSFQPWEPQTFIFRGYNLYIGGLKPSFFMVLGSKANLLRSNLWKKSEPFGISCTLFRNIYLGNIDPIIPKP